MCLRELKSERYVSSWMGTEFDHYICPPLFRLSRLRTGSWKSGVDGRPFNAFDVREKTRIWIINADLQDLNAGCITSCQLSHRSARFL